MESCRPASMPIVYGIVMVIRENRIEKRRQRRLMESIDVESERERRMRTRNEV